MSKYSDKVKRRAEEALALANAAKRRAETAEADILATEWTAVAQRDKLAEDNRLMAERLRDLTATVETLNRKLAFQDRLHRLTAESCERKRLRLRAIMEAHVAAKRSDEGGEQ